MSEFFVVVAKGKHVKDFIAIFVTKAHATKWRRSLSDSVYKTLEIVKVRVRADYGQYMQKVEAA